MSKILSRMLKRKTMRLPTLNEKEISPTQVHTQKFREYKLLTGIYILIFLRIIQKSYEKKVDNKKLVYDISSTNI